MTFRSTTMHPGVGAGPDWRAWSFVAVAAALFALAYRDGIAELAHLWSSREEYSYGWLIPPIAGFFVWQRRAELARIPARGSWWGLSGLLLGVLTGIVGELATLYVLVHYGMLLALWGGTIAWLGPRGARVVWAPLLLLVFMVPLPPFLYNQLSEALQLISSALGVEVVRAFGISVYLEGNVIDLGTYRLQVVEACDGLRYLFPLMAFGFICAYLFQAPMWQRIVVLLSPVPITVFMNSFRIGVIGVLVDLWGPAMAEGFLHDFEGWVIFMVCVGILFAEMWVMTKLTRPQVPLSAVFWPASADGERAAVRAPLAVSRPPLAGALALLAAAVIAQQGVGEREEIIPEREHFSTFPMTLESWQGTRERLGEEFIQALKFSDYLLASYRRDASLVNLYVAYYDSQRKGESAHSPRSCIPGGGWKIERLSQVNIDGAHFAGSPARVNRVEIQRGEHRQLVYYWFQQRGRILTNEYLVKAMLVWDAVTKGRTDGALVRLTTSVAPGQTWEAADAELAAFARALSGRLDSFVPGRGEAP